ncbi:hypothetical protein L9F63_028336, partial [Diploptera punctata]
MNDNRVEVGIDLREYYPSVEWDILGVPAERHEKFYPCCEEPYPVSRKTLRRDKTHIFTSRVVNFMVKKTMSAGSATFLIKTQVNILTVKINNRIYNEMITQNALIPISPCVDYKKCV